LIHKYRARETKLSERGVRNLDFARGISIDVLNHDLQGLLHILQSTTAPSGNFLRLWDTLNMRLSRTVYLCPVSDFEAEVGTRRHVRCNCGTSVLD
jgi:hypothetical protein